MPVRPLLKYAILLAIPLLAGCAATTSLTLTPSPQAPLCQRSPVQTHAVVLWGSQWRADQKDVAAREAAAYSGLAHFFSESGCFASAALHRLAPSSLPQTQAAAAASDAKADLVLVVVVRELGPVLKLGSAAVVEGGTEVVLDFTAYLARAAHPSRAFSAHWRNGGPGVVKGVASLPADIASALGAALQPQPR